MKLLISETNEPDDDQGCICVNYLKKNISLILTNFHKEKHEDKDMDTENRPHFISINRKPTYAT